MANNNKKGVVVPAPASEERITNISERLREPIYSTDDRKLIAKYLQSVANKHKTPKQQETENQISSKLAHLHGLENGYFLSNISKGDDKVLALTKIRQDFVKEYGCKSPSELMLADKIVSAYWRNMRYELYLHRLIEKDDGGYSFDQLKINIMKELHRGIELAGREISLNLTLLKELKQPKLNVKVNAETAYFAQNQQVINEKPNEEPPVETIKPK